MDPFVRLKPDALKIAPEVRCLKSSDYRTLISARELLDAARRAAEALRAQAEEDYARERRRGYDEGLAEARMEMGVRMLETVERSVAYFGQIEHQVADLVMTSLRKILGEFDDTELTLRLVRQALQVVQSQPRVTIRVCPEQAAELQERLSRLIAGYTSLGTAVISADPRLERGGCILETEIGVVEASLDLQLMALDKALRSRLQARDGAADAVDSRVDR
ncbi:HrpE/YscL family type III secretion apparatus protein [Imhoffiella purpurea]|uniref:Type 3 secretion system stator protein n=1 Tax=Imhoffiella purpurea TaxID=1249627 RepID=W9V8A9_9GAMM|nr:HrpE/YscL family type III secretion apparatus protein [Imhoffiella purpurea]EXJ15669.1 Type III secretion cytoplasmic protein (YscL) [Imhoffiella purpurea]